MPTGSPEYSSRPVKRNNQAQGAILEPLVKSGGQEPTFPGKKEDIKLNKQTNQKEIGRIELSDSQDLVISMIDDEKLDLRIWVKTETYTGPTKRGVRFYLFDEIWERFKGLIEAVDKAYNDLT